MLTPPVPDYFQEDSEEALRLRVQWLQAEVSLGDPFFASLLRTDEGTFSRWRVHGAALSSKELGGLREVWEMMMHILGFVNFDSGRARRMLEHVPATDSRPLAAGQAPPWAGSSIKSYLETHGSRAVDDVSRWVTSFRFGPPSLTLHSWSTHLRTTTT
jgi:hypothetical protein